MAGGLLNGDTLSGALAVTNEASGNSTAGTAATHANNLDVGSYAINQGNLANSNYTITYAGANLAVTPLALTVASGVTGTNKVYDSTTNGTLTFSGPTLSGAVSGDTVSINQASGTATFASKDVANGIGVTVSGLGLSGAQAGDYTLTQPVGLTANITPATLTVTGVNASNKVYDGTTTATLTGASGLSGVYSGDTVTVSANPGTGTFAQSNVGNGISVTPSF